MLSSGNGQLTTPAQAQSFISIDITWFDGICVCHGVTFAAHIVGGVQSGTQGNGEKLYEASFIHARISSHHTVYQFTTAQSAVVPEPNVIAHQLQLVKFSIVLQILLIL